MLSDETVIALHSPGLENRDLTFIVLVPKMRYLRKLPDSKNFWASKISINFTESHNWPVFFKTGHSFIYLNTNLEA